MMYLSPHLVMRARSRPSEHGPPDHFRAIVRAVLATTVDVMTAASGR
jgi:hypothetical protein